LYETNAQRVYLVRQDASDELSPGRRASLREELRAASCSGPVAVVLDLAGQGSLDASLAAFWLGLLEDRHADVAVLAVVTGARSLRLATLAFSAVVSLRHLPVEVKAHASGEGALSWATTALARAAAARKLARMARA
jgi:hypothetical protein